MSSSEKNPYPSPNEMSLAAHRAGKAVIPSGVVAAALTAEHWRGLAFTVGAVMAWLLFFMFSALRAAHRWDTCSHCDGPPPWLATEQARARESRRIHSRIRQIRGRMLITTLGLVVFLPKPYLHHWWGQIAQAVVVSGAAVTMVYEAIRQADHESCREECVNDRCRADLKKPRPRAVTLGHYGPWILIVLAPLTAAVGLLSLHRSWQYGVLYADLEAAMALVAVAILLDHTDTPCVRCAVVPSNGGQKAEEYMKWLRRYHRAGVPLLAAAGFLWGVSWLLPHTAAGRILVASAAFALVPWSALCRVHGQLKPWCPWCRRGEGDSESEEVPDPSQNQPVPA